MSSLKFGRSSMGGNSAVSQGCVSNGQAVCSTGPADKTFHIAVIGLVSRSLSGGHYHHSSSSSSSENRSQSVKEEEGSNSGGGPGKSCLCARFLRPAQDNYQPGEHVSVLSAADFASPAINNDHFLYWGEVKKTSDDGQDCRFHLIEQTEFIDDSNFQSFRSGRADKDYVRRATAIKMHSPGKLQYYGRSQLGMEKEFPMVAMPEGGRFSVDGFVCTFDVSGWSAAAAAAAACAEASSTVSATTSTKALGSTSSTSLLNEGSQLETVFHLLTHIVRQKKPVVLALTKADQASPSQIAEANKLVQRKELKGSVQLVEVSADGNVNVDGAFWLVAQAIERSRCSQQQHQGVPIIRYRLAPYRQAAFMCKERMETAAKAFEALIRTHIKERKLTWPEAQRKFHNDQDFKFYCELWGTASAKQLFNSFMGQLRDREARCRLTIYLARLERIFCQLLTDPTLVKSGWSACLEYLQCLANYSSYFADLSGASCDSPRKALALSSCCSDAAYGSTNGVSMTSLAGHDLLDDDAFFEAGDERVPARLLSSSEAQQAFDTFAQSVKRRERQQRLKDEFVALLKDTPYALAGRSYRDLLVFLASEPGYREELAQLSTAVKEEVYAQHQEELTQRATHNFRQLLLDNVTLFQSKASPVITVNSHIAVTPKKRKVGTTSLEDNREEKELEEVKSVLRSDKRFRAMDLLPSHRHVLLTTAYRYYRSSFPQACSLPSSCCDTACIPSFIDRHIKRMEMLPAFSAYINPHRDVCTSHLSIALIGEDDLTRSFRHSIAKAGRALSDNASRHSEEEEDVVEITVDGTVYTINFPMFKTEDLSLWKRNKEPFCHGCVCLYDGTEALEKVEVAMTATVEVEGEEDESVLLLPSNGLPTMLVFAPASDVKETLVGRLRECGQQMATTDLQCRFVQLPRSGSPADHHKEQVALNHLNVLIRQINDRIHLAQSINFFTHSCNDNEGLHHDLIDCDIKLGLCVMCGTETLEEQSQTLSLLLQPLTSHVMCYANPERPSAFFIESPCLCSDEDQADSSGHSRVEIDCHSYHETIRSINNPRAQRDSALPDGFVLLLDLTTEEAAAAFAHAQCVLDSLSTRSVGSRRGQERGCMIVALLHNEEEGQVAQAALKEQERLMEEVQALCQKRNVLLALCHRPWCRDTKQEGSSLTLHTYTPLLQLCQQHKQRAIMDNSYDRASTATLNSTIPSLSDEEAVLISTKNDKSRSLDKKSALLMRRDGGGAGAYQRHGAFVNQANSDGSTGEDSPTFRTFGLTSTTAYANTDAASFIHCKSSSGTSEEEAAATTAMARLSLHHSSFLNNGQLSISRSSEDILSTVQPTSGLSQRPRQLSPAPPVPPRHHPITISLTSSVPSDVGSCTPRVLSAAGSTISLMSVVESAGQSSNAAAAAALARPTTATSLQPASLRLPDDQGEAYQTCSRSASALDMSLTPSPATAHEQAATIKRPIHPFIRGLTLAWQARSTEGASVPTSSSMLQSFSTSSSSNSHGGGGTSSSEKGSSSSSSNRLVGRLTSGGGRYTAFIDQLNANIYAATRGGAGTALSSARPASPTAPLALPELLDDRLSVPPPATTTGPATAASWQAVTERHILAGLKKKTTKEMKPPDRSAFRRVVAPPVKLLSDSLQHYHSFSHQTDILSPTAERLRYPNRASLPDQCPSREYGQSSKGSTVLSLLQSPLDDNVFFPAALASDNEEKMKNGSKPNKAIKPKREKENKSSSKKSKEKKKKVERTFEGFAQSADNPVPLFVELCTRFIEAKGIETEGVYRVSGSRVHADALLNKFLSNPSAPLDMYALDIPIYNVTTALKTFFTEHLPPLVPQSIIDQLHNLAYTTDKAERIHMIKCALAHLSVPHFQCLKYFFAHLQRVTQHSKQNKMDVHNLTVCLWPTLCPIELPQDMALFEGIRVQVSEVLSTIVIEYDRIFPPPAHSISPTPIHEQLSTSLAQEAAQAVRKRAVQVKAVPTVSTDTASSHSSDASSTSYSHLHASLASLPSASSSSSSNTTTKDAVRSSLKSLQV